MDQVDPAESDPSERFRIEIGLDRFVSETGEESLRADGGALAVGRAVFDNVGFIERGRRRVGNVVAGCLPPTKRGSDVLHLSGEAGARLLERAWPLLDAEIKAWCSQRLSPYEWLWMIRRLPVSHIWGVRERLSGRQLLSAAAVSLGTRRSPLRPDGFVAVERTHGQALAYLLGFVDALLDTEMAFRVMGKGGRAILRVSKWRMSLEGDDGLRQRLIEYDVRVRLDPAWGGLGVYSEELAQGVKRGQTDPVGPFTMVFGRVKPIWIDEPNGQMCFERYLEVDVGLNELFELLANAEALPDGVPTEELGALLALVGAYRPLERAGKLTTKTVRMVGYSVHTGRPQVTEVDSFVGEALRAGIEQVQARAPAWAPSSVEGAWRSLRAVRPTIVPRRSGPAILLLDDQGFVIDWHAAGTRLLERLRYPRVSGAAANARSGAFEKSVREAIAQTPCKPAPWLEAIQCHHLKRVGEQTAFGEIDASATLSGGQIHLIVSCKSYLFSEDYQRGVFSVCRNISQQLEKDIIAAISFVDALSASPKGANYAIPAGALLLPVVVTPRQMYCSADIARHRWGDPENGPPICGGLGGLLDYLSGLEPTEE